MFYFRLISIAILVAIAIYMTIGRNKVETIKYHLIVMLTWALFAANKLICITYDIILTENTLTIICNMFLVVMAIVSICGSVRNILIISNKDDISKLVETQKHDNLNNR